MLDRDKAQRALDQALNLLVNGDYELLAAMGTGRGMTADEMKYRINWWGMPIEKPPGLKWESLTIIPIDRDVGRWAVDVDLWSSQIGSYSDMMALFELSDTQDSLYRVDLRDVRMM